MPRAAVVLLSLAVVVASGTAAMSSTPLPRGYNVVSSANLYTGVDYVKLSKPSGPVVAHVARILPGAPIDFRVVNATDKISTGIRELETTSSMCRRVHCIVGVNGDFHRLGVPAGGVVTDGRMLRSPNPDRAQLTVTTDGQLVAGAFPWTAALTAGDGVQIPVTAVNDDPLPDGLALYTPAWGSRTETSGRTELMVRALDAIGSLNRSTDLEVTGIRTGAGPIPSSGAVLSGDGSAAQQLLDLWARRQNGLSPRVRLLVSSPINASASLGVEPVVLHDGRRALPWRDPNLINPRQPHTLVGWNKAGETYLVAVDGRQSDSEGVTMADAADFLLGLGATEAVSLDGGGGTTFVAGGSIWNRPSDNDPVRPAEYEERGAVNAFVVVSRAGEPLPAASPPPPPPLPALPSSPTVSGGGAGSPGTVPGEEPGRASWPTPEPGSGAPVGPTTSRPGGNPATPNVVLSPASAGSRVLPGLAAPRLILIDPPASDAAAEGAAFAAPAVTGHKVAAPKGSDPPTRRGTSGPSDAGSAPPDARSTRWSTAVKVGAALGAAAFLRALLAHRRRPLLSV